MFEVLLQGDTITVELEEQIIFNQLDKNINAIWSLMLASGYLKIEDADIEEEQYTLSFTNYEVKRMMRSTVRGWFKQSEYFKSIACL